MKKIKILCSSLLLTFPLFLYACKKDNSKQSESIFDSDNITESVSEKDDSESISESESEHSEESEITYNMNKKQALDALASTPYKSDIRVEENIGLSNPSVVGIDEDKLFNEELYPVPELDSSKYHIYSAKDDIGMYEGAINNAGTLSTFIENIRNVDGIKIILLEDITYEINAPINVSTVKDLYIVGQEHTMFLSNSWGSYFLAKSCKNIHLNNIQFDMKNSPTISGEIISFNEEDTYADVTLKVPDEFDLSFNGYRAFDSSSGANGQCSYMECYLDPVTNKYVPDSSHNLFYNSSGSVGQYGVDSLQFKDDTMTVRLKKSFPFMSYRNPVIGTHVSFAFTMYQNFGLSFEACEEVYVENCNVYVTGGMGVHFSGGKNIYLNRFNFKNKEGSKRIMTCTADIIHSVSVENELKVTNCILEASHDDALNIKTWYCNISSASKISSIYTIKQGGQTPDTKFEVGDIIELYDKGTLERVKSFEIIKLEKNGVNYDATVKGINGARVSEDDTKYLVGNDTKATHLYLHNCLIQNKRNRGILLQARHSEISNCCFRNIVHGAIQVLGVRDSFGEAILPDNILIKNNKFFNNQSNDINVFSYGSSGQGAIGNIHDVEINNNYIRNCINYAVYLWSTKDVNVTYNLIHSKTKNDQICRVRTSASCLFENNKFIVASGNLPGSILQIEEGLEDIRDINNTLEVFN